MESILALISYISGFFDFIVTYLTETVVDMFKAFVEWATVSFVVAYIETKIWLLEFSWQVASGVLQSFNISSVVSSHISGLPGGVGHIASGAGLIDAFNMMAQAYVASIVLRFTGF